MLWSIWHGYRRIHGSITWAFHGNYLLVKDCANGVENLQAKVNVVKVWDWGLRCCTEGTNVLLDLEIQAVVCHEVSHVARSGGFAAP